MAATYQLISSVTVGSGGASSIDFTSIPATYTDLIIKFSGRDNNAQVYGTIGIQFNNTGGTGYSYRRLEGNGSSVSSANQSSVDQIYVNFGLVGANATASTFSNLEIYIPNYAGSINKSVSVDSVTENNGTSAYAILNAGLWSNTSAINRVTLTNAGSGNTWQQNTTAYLYGIKNS